MSKITEKYWKWDSSFDHIEFKLDEPIITKLKKGLVSLKNNGENEYTGINEFPWVIKTYKDKIVGIYYREIFPDLIVKDLWELKLENFSKIVDDLLDPVSKNYKGKILYVAFRDSFVTLAAIINNSKED